MISNKVFTTTAVVLILLSAQPSLSKTISNVGEKTVSQKVIISDATNDLIQVISWSYQRAFGRNATEGDIGYWIGRSNNEKVTANMLMLNHRGWLRSGNELNETIVRSYQAVFSRSPNVDEVSYWRQRIRRENLVYTDLVRNHNSWKNSGGR
jgi:hypothetical protein